MQGRCSYWYQPPHTILLKQFMMPAPSTKRTRYWCERHSRSFSLHRRHRCPWRKGHPHTLWLYDSATLMSTQED